MQFPRHEVTDPDLYLSRPLSWLDFNERVTALAGDAHRPLLERLNFLAISGQNLDFFFMKRIASLKREGELGVPRLVPSPLTVAAELAAVRDKVRAMQSEHQRLLHDELLPGLAEHGVRLMDYASLDAGHVAYLDRYFEHQLFPILTPLAVDPGRPFPFISNLSLSLAVMLQHEDEAPVFARIKAPTNRPRWVQLPDTLWFVPLEQVIAHRLDWLFRQMDVLSCHSFRLTRSADVPRDDAAADDLMDFAVDLVRERRFAPVVRLEVDSQMPAQPLALLTDELALEPESIYPQEGLLALSDLATLAALDLPAAAQVGWAPQPQPRFPDGEAAPAEVFDAIRGRDILVHHPYHDYERTVVAFLNAAADDPQVLAIKQSLYRTSAQSPTLEALIRAAEKGKEVTALLELKARLDEASNIAWARRLEQSGIHTSYGFVGVKTHTRVTLVVRQEHDGLRQYAHFSTGDYNHVTACSYSDLGLFTADRDIGADLVEFFNFLTGFADVPAYRRLVVAPVEMRQRLLRRIHEEIEHQRAGRGGRIIAMMNSLADVPLTSALYEASQAGVQVDLILRGECTLRPGVPGVSENIRVRSVLGRFLQHERIFYFGGGGEPKVKLGSADWMYRNLDHRVEAMLLVEEREAKHTLIDLLHLFLEDTDAAWELQADGRWRRVAPEGRRVSAQETLMALARRQDETNTSSSTTFTE